MFFNLEREREREERVKSIIKINFSTQTYDILPHPNDRVDNPYDHHNDERLKCKYNHGM